MGEGRGVAYVFQQKLTLGLGTLDALVEVRGWFWLLGLLGGGKAFSNPSQLIFNDSVSCELSRLWFWLLLDSMLVSESGKRVLDLVMLNLKVLRLYLGQPVESCSLIETSNVTLNVLTRFQVKLLVDSSKGS